MLDEELSGNNTADAPRGSGAIERWDLDYISVEMFL